MARNGNLSFWMSRDNLRRPITTALDRSVDVDVAIVGAGLSGLWTAWALRQSDPSMSVAVFEAEELGFGASGRNCGWLSSKPVGIRSVLAKVAGRDAVLDTEAALREAMHDVVEILGADAIDARHGGATQVARSASEQRRIEAYVAANREWGVDETHLRLLSAAEASERVRIAGLTGAAHTPDNYCVDPTKMLFRLANLVAGLGVTLYTHSRVTSIEPGRLLVGPHRVNARRRIVVATEGYSSTEAGHKRNMLPLNSSMVITEPLTDEQWRAVGWSHADGVSGTAHTYFYGQRTPDGRIALGGRGKPYRFGSGFDDRGHIDEATVRALTHLLADMFPQVAITSAHAWCGVLGVTRDWSPFVHADGAIVRMGGYAGQGLTASHLAARIAAGLVTDRHTPLTRLPWVRPMPRRWEPEPLRWIGATALYTAYRLADVAEARSNSDRTSPLALVANKISGR
ncbi:NAD(P)/FAD-dependent oxidoreductase [Mycolicibacterium smegmatis]|uniref:Glycine/D-amino acid oxidase n=1 Tax=Mycolicibacterium smegmatis (strain MKD8) TaxID=1214915 RepID=A0A2U9PIF7_MYCSE|nr:FAD-dependent oxidoreductase [Mycolicibacterium smegmatis]AWT51510.1 glycine/D-amino acid oxidase [Mycolicibacterium smegmatis MKD8]